MSNVLQKAEKNDKVTFLAVWETVKTFTSTEIPNNETQLELKKMFWLTYKQS
jgi:hypothetical protein